MNSNLLSFSHRKHTSVLHSHFIRSLAHNAFYHPHNAFLRVKMYFSVRWKTFTPNRWRWDYVERYRVMNWPKIATTPIFLFLNWISHEIWLSCCNVNALLFTAHAVEKQQKPINVMKWVCCLFRLQTNIAEVEADLHVSAENSRPEKKTSEHNFWRKAHSMFTHRWIMDKICLIC